MEARAPCPFCKNPEAHVCCEADSAYVHCDDCGADGPVATGPDPCRVAVELWNTRPMERQLQASLDHV